MKVNQLVEKVLENWHIKIFCIIAATLLYLFNSFSTVEKKSFVVPVQVIQDGSVMQVGSLRKNVNVVVRLAQDETSSIHANQIHASVNLNSFTESGTYSVPVNIELDEQLLEIDPLEIRVNPEFLEVRVENREFKYVPVEISFVGEPEHGYFVSEYSVSPTSVEITGPGNSVLATQKLSTERVDLSGAKRSFEAETKIHNINNMIEITEDTECLVNVKIEPLPMEKVFENLPILITNLNPAFEVSSDIPRVSVKLKGLMPALETYNISSNAVQADLGSISEAGTYEIPLRFFVPSAFNILQKSAETLKVNIVRKPEVQQEETQVSAEE